MKRFALPFVLAAAAAAGGSTVIDHTCTGIESIPGTWIDQVQSTMKSHYAHTSHGSQLTWGLQFVEEGDPAYAYLVGYGQLPSSSTAYCVFDGQEGESYVTPDLYWESAAGIQMTRDVLEHNPSICTSMWGWCSQCDYYSQAQVAQYLAVMSQLEAEFPEVTFIYFTGNAQSEGAAGYERHQRNEQIRNYCLANDKVLFDFADLDCWWFNPGTQAWEQNTYTYGGNQVPSEHPQFSGDEYGHTTAESCEQKGRAWWYMMAVLAGWSGTGVEEGTEDPCGTAIAVSPNPSPGTAEISIDLADAGPVRVSVLDIAGRQVWQTGWALLDCGCHTFPVTILPSGIYLVTAEACGERLTTRLAVLD